jgi:diaminopimelate epimerase
MLPRALAQILPGRDEKRRLAETTGLPYITAMNTRPDKPLLNVSIAPDQVVAGLIGRPYQKMNGLGNEILVVDLRGTTGTMPAQAARAIGRSPALHFDQMMVLHDPRSSQAAADVTIFNSDGSLAEACGNGARCVAFVLLQPDRPGTVLLQTAAGLIECRRVGAMTFSVDMGQPRLKWDEIPLSEPFADTRAVELQIGPIDAPILHSPSVINMGNPHAVFWVDDIDVYQLDKIGPLLENHPLFPERANISLARVRTRKRIDLRVWERGAGLTLACGTAACAAVVAAVRKNLTERSVEVTLPGGTLSIEWRNDDHVIMSGPVAWEGEGTLQAAHFAGIDA